MCSYLTFKCILNLIVTVLFPYILIHATSGRENKVPLLLNFAVHSVVNVIYAGCEINEWTSTLLNCICVCVSAVKLPGLSCLRICCLAL